MKYSLYLALSKENIHHDNTACFSFIADYRSKSAAINAAGADPLARIAIVDNTLSKYGTVTGWITI